MKYRVRKKAAGSLAGSGSGPGAVLMTDIPLLELSCHMGQKPEHFPRTLAGLVYEEDALFVFFKVEDRYVRAVAKQDQDNVFEDSCVEFFFTPGPDVSKGYFNLEMNCGGTMLFHFQTQRGKDRVIISQKECESIFRSSSLPRRVDPEIKGPCTWFVSYRLCVSLLKHYTKVMQPRPGIEWRANFYKCGDGTSHPHWLTWAPVDGPKPDFHRPESFGILEFE